MAQYLPLVPVLWLQLVLVVVGTSIDESSPESCSAQVPRARVGAQLLQLTKLNTRRKAPSGWQADGIGNGTGNVTDESDLICSQKVGKEAPLSSDGFETVSDSCCFDDMKDFIRRAVQMEGLQVCDEGGLSGLTPFFSCSNKTTSFARLESAIQRARGGTCAWLGNEGEPCESPDAKCGVSVNPDRREAMFKGYIGVEAEKNPPALVTNSKVADRVRKLLANDLSVAEEAVAVSVGTGPVGESRYPVTLKSRTTGHFVAPHVDGHLEASSVELKTFMAVYDPGSGLFSLEDIAVEQAKLVTSNGNAIALSSVNVSTPPEGYFAFQSEDGSYVCEDGQGHVILSNSTEAARLQVDFTGFSSLLSMSSSISEQSFVALRQSCTVFVTYEVVQTDPPTLVEAEVKQAVNMLDPEQLQTEMSAEIANLEPCIGSVGISTFKYCGTKMCNSKSLKMAHTDQAYHHVSNDGDNVTMPKLRERSSNNNSLF